jgi:dienelactone hydrolase
MRSILLLLALCSFYLHAGEATPPDPQDLSGAWRGIMTLGNETWYGRLELKRSGKDWSGVVLWWQFLTTAESERLIKGTKGKNWLSSARAMTENMLLREDTAKGVVMFRAVTKANRIIGAAFIFQSSVDLSRDGSEALLGCVSDPKLGKVMYQFVREERWLSGPAPGTVKPGQEQKEWKLSCPDPIAYSATVRLPKGYDPAKPPPVLIHHSPGGNAKPFMPKILDELGWVGVGLTQSKNGPWEAIVHNRDAVIVALRRQISIDWNRVYFCGGSGGGRASMLSGISTPGTAGLLCVVGVDGPFPVAWLPKECPIFFITGKKDDNHDEVVNAYQQQNSAGRKVKLIDHDGGHDAGGNENLEKALHWLATASAVAEPPAKAPTK